MCQREDRGTILRLTTVDAPKTAALVYKGASTAQRASWNAIDENKGVRFEKDTAMLLGTIGWSGLCSGLHIMSG